MINIDAYKEISSALAQKNVTLIAVSKTKPVEDILALYNLGQRDFGENYVQELVEKQPQLPQDIRWHFIGHLQSNKVKYITPFIHLVHSIDNLKLLLELNKQARKNSRIINCLLQIHIAQEETKFGLSGEELEQLIGSITTDATGIKNICLRGVMGMASNTDDLNKIRSEFRHLKSLFDKYSSVTTVNAQLSILSMGMSSDYQVAMEEGSNMIRVGTLLFGARNYNQ